MRPAPRWCEGRNSSNGAQTNGVVTGFASWNFRINSPARKISTALATGCAIILKESDAPRQRHADHSGI
nr:aldehyde dehydrogenase family protein [Puniceibacterium sp. IMCC21224]